jgi:hypothetical protein
MTGDLTIDRREGRPDNRMSEQTKIINFTRGVPANDSFPIDEVLDAAHALKATRRRCCI